MLLSGEWLVSSAVLCQLGEAAVCWPSFQAAGHVDPPAARSLVALSHFPIAALSVAYTPIYARIVRGNVLSIKEEAYIEAAKTIGVAGRKIAFQGDGAPRLGGQHGQCRCQGLLRVPGVDTGHNIDQWNRYCLYREEPHECSDICVHRASF